MSAEILREAARLMRERAEKASPGPWASRHGDRAAAYIAAPDALGPFPTFRLADGLDVHDANHIASWHPAVAVEVAEFLEFVADHHDTLTAAMDMGETNLSPTAIDHTTGMGHALAVARAYLTTPHDPSGGRRWGSSAARLRHNHRKKPAPGGPDAGSQRSDYRRGYQ